MKKSYFVLSAAVMLLAACTGNKSQQAAENADAQADSIVAEEQVEAPEATPAIKGELGLFELQGPVKSCTLKNRWGKITRTFDEQGMWATYEGKALSKVYSRGIKRDDNGRIVEGKMSDGGTDHYEYDAEGRETRYFYQMGDESTEWIITYDADGNRQSNKVTEITFDSDGEPYTETYKILESDDHGNWTKRQVLENGDVSDTHTRTITYYE